MLKRLTPSRVKLSPRHYFLRIPNILLKVEHSNILKLLILLASIRSIISLVGHGLFRVRIRAHDRVDTAYSLHLIEIVLFERGHL